MYFQNTNICLLSLWILWVQSAENPQETKLLLYGKPSGLTACCTRSVQSHHLRNWCNNIYSIVFLFLFCSGRAKDKCGV